MAGQGTGPSRRSHTKSRTGCKTCKRRHIRCDETFPQCRNCTKHQVRCDYMENVPSDGEQASIPEQASVPSTPGTDQRINLWLQTGEFPYPELQVYPPPQPHNYSRSDLQLITHLSSIARSLVVNGTSEMTVWSSRVSQYLSIASSYPYVMHAYLAFSASHLAWTSPASDARKLQIQHGGIALRGLHDSISSFSKSNADSVLAASILLMTQANDWRTWSSLEAGVKSVCSAMEDWKHESLFAEILGIRSWWNIEESRSLPTFQERQATLSGIISALQRLQPFLTGHETESQWISQLLGYIRTLLSSPPAQTPAEQFDQLYRLRKWVLFVPSLLLDEPVVEGPAILVLAHLYATALAIEPLFPSLGIGFCAAISFGPLEKIIQMTAPMQMEQHFGQTALEIGSLMHFPQQAAATYRARLHWAQQHQIAESRMQSPPQQLASFSSSAMMDMGSMAYTPFANMSPGFVPSSLSAHPRLSSPGSHSPYLEVPTAGTTYDPTGYSYGAAEWGGAPSPAFPPQPYMSQEEEQGYDSGIGRPYGGSSGGFVNAPPIWT